MVIRLPLSTTASDEKIFSFLVNYQHLWKEIFPPTKVPGEDLASYYRGRLERLQPDTGSGVKLSGTKIFSQNPTRLQKTRIKSFNKMCSESE